MSHHHLCTCTRCRIRAEDRHALWCGCPCCDLARHPEADDETVSSEPRPVDDETSMAALTTVSAILALQSHAVATNDIRLLYLTRTALGINRCPGSEPVTLSEQAAAIRSCRSQLEMMAAMGEAVYS